MFELSKKIKEALDNMQAVQNKYSSLQIAKSRQAKLKEHSFNTAYLIDKQETITVKYKNTGEPCIFRSEDIKFQRKFTKNTLFSSSR